MSMRNNKDDSDNERAPTNSSFLLHPTLAGVMSGHIHNLKVGETLAIKGTPESHQQAPKKIYDSESISHLCPTISSHIDAIFFFLAPKSQVL